MSKKVPVQKPGKSDQDVCTPIDLLDAIKNRLHISKFSIDLAASQENKVADMCYTKEDNSLTKPWNVVAGSWGYCNPPYAKLGPWIDKAILESSQGAQTVMLVPASVGSNWWIHAANSAYIVFLNGRVTFVGHTTPYPKDLALLLFTPWGFVGNEIWTWKTYEAKGSWTTS